MPRSAGRAAPRLAATCRATPRHAELSTHSRAVPRKRNAVLRRANNAKRGRRRQIRKCAGSAPSASAQCPSVCPAACTLARSPALHLVGLPSRPSVRLPSRPPIRLPSRPPSRPSLPSARPLARSPSRPLARPAVLQAASPTLPAASPPPTLTSASTQYPTATDGQQSSGVICSTEMDGNGQLVGDGHSSSA